VGEHRPAAVPERSALRVSRPAPLIALALLCLLPACTYRTLAPIQTYDGPPRPVDQVAIVQPQWDEVHVVFQKVDGASLRPHGEVGLIREVHVAPGPHTVEVAFVAQRLLGTEVSGKIKSVSFTAAAAGRYEIRAERTSGFAILGTIFEWTPWVVELPSERIVGGDPPPRLRDAAAAK